MVLGACEETSLKKRSEELGLSFSDLLWGYMIEDMMLRICASEYKEILWLETVPVLGKDAYCAREQKRLRFFYQESERKIPAERLEPGQKLTSAMVERLLMDLFLQGNKQEIHWMWRVNEEKGAFFVSLEGDYRNMKVPIMLCIRGGREERQIPGKREEVLTAIPGGKVSYLIYAPENQLSRDLFMILEQLELVRDMECYWSAYEILKSQSLSGRFVLEELEVLSKEKPGVKTKKRLQQVAGYREYAYMRKRWDKYARNHGKDPVPWKEALDLILAFTEPLWNSFCENEIFFDDWMPELGRFLG